MVDEYNPPKKSLSTSNAVLTAIYMIMCDLVIYSCIIPLLGTYLAGQSSVMINVGPVGEVVAVVVITFTLMYCTFSLIGEANYWKHLFAFDQFYSCLLQFRDAINVIICIMCLFGIGHTIVAMVEQDKYMKDQYLSEGAFYVFLKKICEGLNINPSVLASIGLEPDEVMKNSIAENNRIEHGATYMIFWAMLTACISKLMYFNTLFTYLRAMEIFITMKPSFEEENEVCGKHSSTTNFRMTASPSRLENDFARSVRKSNVDNKLK